MSWALHLVDMVSGRKLRELPDVSFSWTQTLRSAELGADEQNMGDNGISSLSFPWAAFTDEADLEALFMPGDKGIVAEWNGIPRVWGEIGDTQDDGTNISIDLTGIGTILGRLVVVPETAVQAQLAGDKTAVAKAVWQASGVDIGTLGKRELQAVQQKPQALPPLVFNPDRNGTLDDNMRTVKGFNLANISVGNLLTNMSNVVGGPDIDIRPEKVDDRTVRLRYVSGHPQLEQTRVWSFDWEKGAPGGDVVQCTYRRSAKTIADRVYYTGAGTDDATLVAVAQVDQPPKNRLFREIVKSDTSVDGQDLLESKAQALLAASRAVQGQLTMKFIGDGVNPLGDFWPGDMCEITIAGLPSLNNGRRGTYRMRCMQLSGDATRVAQAVFDVIDAKTYKTLEG